MTPVAPDLANARRLRQLLVAMVLLLTFEGIARKASPSELRVPLFLLKDFLTTIMAFYVLRMPISPTIRSLWNAYMIVAFLMIPSIVMTAFHDPVLAIFGTKQYLLFPIVGFAMFQAFEHSRWSEVLAFYRGISLLLIPTVVLAIVQVKLPHDSWLNMSVNGESMEAFQAAGQLRVSSTFPFVAQYSAFLNLEAFALIIALHNWSKGSTIWKIISLSLIPAIVVSSFITGSRTAVVGNLAIIMLALLLASFKPRASGVLQVILAIFVLYLGVLTVNYFFPNATAAYSARESGHLIGISLEIRGRVFDSFFGIQKLASMQTFLGNGLGVMSNGSDSISNYAAIWRANFWTETDFGTTLFEGGYYLVIVWYGFRAFVVLKTLKHFLADITPEFSVPLAFCEAFVIIGGVLDTLALQPPVAIWWWMGVGTTLLFAAKCQQPAEAEEKPPGPPAPMPIKKVRGRSLYADVIHSRK